MKWLRPISCNGKLEHVHSVISDYQGARTQIGDVDDGLFTGLNIGICTMALNQTSSEGIILL